MLKRLNPKLNTDRLSVLAYKVADILYALEEAIDFSFNESRSTYSYYFSINDHKVRLSDHSKKHFGKVSFYDLKDINEFMEEIEIALHEQEYFSSLLEIRTIVKNFVQSTEGMRVSASKAIKTKDQIAKREHARLVNDVLNGTIDDTLLSLLNKDGSFRANGQLMFYRLLKDKYKAKKDKIVQVYKHLVSNSFYEYSQALKI